MNERYTIEVEAYAPKNTLGVTWGNGLRAYGISAGFEAPIINWTIDWEGDLTPLIDILRVTEPEQMRISLRVTGEYLEQVERNTVAYDPGVAGLPEHVTHVHRRRTYESSCAFNSLDEFEAYVRMRRNPPY